MKKISIIILTLLALSPFNGNGQTYFKNGTAWEYQRAQLYDDSTTYLKAVVNSVAYFNHSKVLTTISDATLATRLYTVSPPISNGRYFKVNSGIGRLDTATFFRLTYSGTASRPAFWLDGTPYSGTGTTSTPLVLMQEAATSVKTNWHIGGTYLGVNARTGFVGNLLDIGLAGTSKLTVNSDGTLTYAGSYQLNGTTGNASVNALMSSYDVATNYFEIAGKSRLYSTSDGVFLMTNNGATDFTRLQFGVTTSSGTALAKAGTKMVMKLADNSANTHLQVKDTIYSSLWNGRIDVPTMNAVYDKMELMAPITSPTFTGTVTAPIYRTTTNFITIDTVYGTNWNSNFSVPTKNAVYDKIELLAPISSPTFTGTVTVPSLNFNGATSSDVSFQKAGVKIVARNGDNTANINLQVKDTVYNATTWDGSLDVPTKNAVRDQLETINAVSGVWTPTLTSAGNISSTTARECYYIRVGNKVTCGGTFAITPTTGATSTTLRMTLPISSTFTTIYQAGGTATGGGTVMDYMTVNSSTSNPEVFISTQSCTNSGVSVNMSFQFIYTIL